MSGSSHADPAAPPRPRHARARVRPRQRGSRRRRAQIKLVRHTLVIGDSKVTLRAHAGAAHLLEPRHAQLDLLRRQRHVRTLQQRNRVEQRLGPQMRLTGGVAHERHQRSTRAPRRGSNLRASHDTLGTRGVAFGCPRAHELRERAAERGERGLRGVGEEGVAVEGREGRAELAREAGTGAGVLTYQLELRGAPFADSRTPPAIASPFVSVPAGATLSVVKKIVGQQCGMSDKRVMIFGGEPGSEIELDRSTSVKTAVWPQLQAGAAELVLLYAIHTNLDNVSDGVNQKIAEKLGLLNTKILAPKKELLKKD